jgi:hypothetical protein
VLGPGRAESGGSYELPPVRRRTGGVGTDQLQKVWPRSQRYWRYCPSSRELPVRDAGAWQMVQRRPVVLMCTPYSRRSEARRAIQVALRAEASAGRSE